MVKRKYIIAVNRMATIIVFFSIGYLFGAESPNIPTIIWIVLIFVCVIAKIWVHDQSDKLKWKINVKDNSSVSLLLKDRPEIAEILNDYESLKRWLIEQFSGKATKFPILWDPNEPEESNAAEHCYPRRNKPAKIRVSRNMSGLDQLSGILFELFNIRYNKKHRRLRKKACKGEIGKQEYSFRSYQLEYKAWKKCRRFFKKHSSVFATADDSNEVYNMIMSLTSFREFYAIMKERYDGKTYFEKVYDKRIEPYLSKKSHD